MGVIFILGFKVKRAYRGHCIFSCQASFQSVLSGKILKMSVERKFLEKLLSGLADKNLRFEDLRKLLIDLGFHERIKGSHHIFYKAGIEEIINLQPLSDGKAKPYQVKQVRELILKYKLHKGVIDV